MRSLLDMMRSFFSNTVDIFISEYVYLLAGVAEMSFDLRYNGQCKTETNQKSNLNFDARTLERSNVKFQMGVVCYPV